MYSFYSDILELLEKPWLLSLTIVVGSLISAWLVEVIVCRSLASVAAKTVNDLDDKIIAVIRKPLFLSVLLYGLTWALEPVGVPVGVLFVLFAVFKSVAVLLWASASFAVGGLVLEAMSHQAGADSILQRRTVPVFNIVIKAATLGIAIYFLFLAWDIDVTAWLASAGIIGIAVGFAAQDTLANLFAGIFIIADAPYKVDDFIVLDGELRGRVTRIGARSTRVLTLDDVEITIPNSVIGGSTIVNEAGGPDLKQRVAVSVDAAYGADVDEVRKVLLSCTDGIDGICQSPSPTTRFRSFGGSGLSFQLLVWITEPVRRDVILDVLHERVYKAFNTAGLEIPFSKHDLYVKEMPSHSA